MPITEENKQIALQHQMNLLQGIINRMADNSRHCKTWCVSLVSALLVLAAAENINLPWIIVGIPVLPLGLMDAYYLGLELHFRKSYEKIVGYSSKPEVSLQEVYEIDRARKWPDIRAALSSPAVWFFYSLLIFLVILIQLCLDKTL